MQLTIVSQKILAIYLTIKIQGIITEEFESF